MTETTLTILLWATFFYGVNHSVAARTRKRKKPLKIDQNKFNNIATSLIHAILSGIGSVYSLSSAELRRDPILTESKFSVYLTRMSFGYLLYDLFDLLRLDNFKLRRKSAELLLHHVVVLACAVPNAIFERFSGLTMFAMAVEANSIFLHSRRLLKYRGKMATWSYTINALLNVITNVLFRLCTCSYLIHYALNNLHLMGRIWGMICVLGATTVLVMSVVLLYRCIKSDFVKQKSALD